MKKGGTPVVELMCEEIGQAVARHLGKELATKLYNCRQQMASMTANLQKARDHAATVAKRLEKAEKELSSFRREAEAREPKPGAVT